MRTFPPAAGLVAAIWNHPANRASPLSAVGRMLAWQLRKRIHTSSRIQPFHGLRFECAPDSHVGSAVVYFAGLPDYHEMLFLRRYLRRADNFVDVGANVGVYTLLAASVVGVGRIDAFEPGATATLRRNVALNGLTNVVIHETALADRCGDRAFASEGSSELARLLPAGDNGGEVVKCTTFDEALSRLPYAMAKLDVEGAEPLVLRGATQHLAARNPPVWQLELDGYSQRFGYSTHEVVAWLEETGYDTFVYDADAATLARVDYPRQVGRANALAIARDRLEEVATRADATVIA